jgi:hypothetical protein
MARDTAPTNQWKELNAEKVAGRGARAYPGEDASGVWGWTDREDEAEGMIGTSGGVLGVDDSTTTGGARVVAMDGVVAFATVTS